MTGGRVFGQCCRGASVSRTDPSQSVSGDGAAPDHAHGATRTDAGAAACRERDAGGPRRKPLLLAVGVPFADGTRTAGGASTRDEEIPAEIGAGGRADATAILIVVAAAQLNFWRRADQVLPLLLAGPGPVTAALLRAPFPPAAPRAALSRPAAWLADLRTGSRFGCPVPKAASTSRLVSAVPATSRTVLRRERGFCVRLTMRSSNRCWSIGRSSWCSAGGAR